VTSFAPPPQLIAIAPSDSASALTAIHRMRIRDDPGRVTALSL
jgi:hypothetical protein